MRISVEVNEYRPNSHETLLSVDVGDGKLFSVLSYKPKTEGKRKLKEGILRSVREHQEAERNHLRKAILFGNGEVALIEWRYGSWFYSWIGKGRERSSGGSGGKTLEETIEQVKSGFSDVKGGVIWDHYC